MSTKEFSMRLFLFVAFLFFNLTVSRSQDTFKKTFLNSYTERTSYIASNDNGDYFLVVEVSLTVPTESDGFIVTKFDGCDKMLWSKHYITTEDIYLGDVEDTRDGGLVITGQYQDEGGDAAFIRLDASGELIFAKRLGTPNAEHVYSVGQLADGNFFIYGNSTEWGPASTNFVIKVNGSGETIWSKLYFEIAIWGRTIATSDGGILARTGRVCYKIDAEGDLDWAHEYSGASYYESKPVEVEGGYVCARYPSSGGGSPQPAYLFKMDFNGNVVWEGQRFHTENIRNITQLSNGNFVAVGHLFVDTIGLPNRVFTSITMLDDSGKVVEQKLMLQDGDETHYGNDVAALADGAFVFSGIEQNNNRSYISKGTEQFVICESMTYQDIEPDESFETSPRSIAPHNANFTSEDLPFTISDVNNQEEIDCSEEFPMHLDLGPDTTLCPGATLDLESNINYPFYKWSTGADSSNITVNSQGTYWLEISNGCDTLYDTITVNYHPVLVLDYDVSPKMATPFEAVRFSSFTQGASEIFWDFGEGTSTEVFFSHLFEKNGSYEVFYQVRDAYGCTYSESTGISMEYFSLYIPNTITTNGDGLNDLFQPYGFGIKTYTMKVFNRWGELVFEGRDQGWNGKINGTTAPLDSYVYDIEVEDEFGNTHPRKGLLHLVR